MIIRGSENDLIAIEQRGHVRIVRIQNPPDGCIAAKGARQLLTVLADAFVDHDVRAIVLVGAQPDVFIRHAEVRGIGRAAAALAEGRIAPADFANNPFLDLVERLDRAEKPVIAAINGICMGGGLEIALACTARIAGRNVKAIGLPEIRIDIIPGAGGMVRLARLIGMHQARLHVLRGSVLDAVEAHAQGIVDEVADDPFAAALDLADAIAHRHPAAVTAIMRSFRDGLSSRQSGPTFASVIAEPGVLDRLERFISCEERLDQVP
ncbi:enoyl-CoA hydratase/isomerase family protein [Novosphingobium cyanobacteriorum]|uniref:Enoyl-CoA hydratase/isomerase family protein n=1 Tax=Novosphingobium cyanobacteriorum TaxID=3024215 RepID=A0ABT6CIL6_9SPHN|nr:enoyl-CoA hydratase/isomerase family protein [Novosphingobium cyanobacteriorum]MDF8332192.1 enoyl-CoA hydratase/isomerase family protein [Novosphingobium cyanobacteriorum]